MVEVELRRRIEKLNATICELVTANRSWDDHCKKLELDHNHQVTALNSDLTTLRRHLQDVGDLQCRYDELRAADERKQVEFDQMLLNAKKQREIEEMAKEEALNQLHQEKRFRVESDARCVELELKIAQLEARYRELQLVKQANVFGASGHESARTLSAGDRDLELQILREQVTVFKEDFDQERRDREAAQQTCERLQAQLNTTSTQLDDTRNKLFRTVDEMKQVQNQNEQFRSRFDQLADEIKVLQRQTRPQQLQQSHIRPVVTSPAHVATGNYVTAPTPVVTQRHGLPTTSTYNNRHPNVVTFEPTVYLPQQQLVQSGVLSNARWPCPKCTFFNSASRVTCEMCGLLVPRDAAAQPVIANGATTYDIRVSSGRPVAGLPVYTTRTALPDYTTRTLQNGSQPWLHLANSGLETDEPMPPSSSG
jgi:predicted nuclease with TOPRIM domain